LDGRPNHFGSGSIGSMLSHWRSVKSDGCPKMAREAGQGRSPERKTGPDVPRLWSVWPDRTDGLFVPNEAPGTSRDLRPATSMGHRPVAVS